jgi:hypothetical protein
MAGDATINAELYLLMKQLAGGANSLQTLADEFAAELDLGKDPLIGAAGLLMTGAEQTLYDINGLGIPWIFNGGYIDLSPLAAGDVVIVRIYVTSGDGVNLRKLTLDASNTYTGVCDPPQIEVPELEPCSYEVKVTIQQTVVPVAYKTLFCHFYDSVRGV